MNSTIRYILEGIDHLENSGLGKLLENEIAKLRKYNVVKDKDVFDTKLASLIKEHTGLNVKITTEESEDAYVFVPDLNKNNPIINQWRRYYFDNVDAKDFFAEKNIVEGTVSLKDARVYGDFTKINISIVIGSAFFTKRSDYTIPEVVAIILHEVGHAFVYLEMLGRCTRTNYILSEGVKRLMTANTKEQRIVLLERIEDLTNVKIKDKESLAKNKRSEVIYRSVIVSNLVEESKQDLNLNVYDSRSFEQLADNFSARFGYAVPLATGLAKSYKKYGDTVYLTPMMNILFNIFKAIGLVCISVLNPFQGAFTVVILLLQGSPLNVTYDPPKQRITKIKQQINDVLKNPKLNVKQKQVFIEQHEEIEAILDTMYDNIGAYETLWNYVFPWGIRQKSLIEVQQELESMYNNDLFASAAKLDVLKLEDYEEETAFNNLNIALEEYEVAINKYNQFLILEDYIQTANITNVSLEDYGDLSKLAGVNISQEDIGTIIKHGVQFILKHLGVIIVALIVALRLFLRGKNSSGSSGGGSSSPLRMTSVLTFKIDGVDIKIVDKVKEHARKNSNNILAIYDSFRIDHNYILGSYVSTVKKVDEEYLKAEKQLLSSSPVGEHKDISKIYTDIRERVTKHIGVVLGTRDSSITNLSLLTSANITDDQLKDDFFLQNLNTHNVYKTLEAALKELVYMEKKINSINNITDNIRLVSHNSVVNITNEKWREMHFTDSVRAISRHFESMKSIFFEKNYNFVPYTGKYIISEINSGGGRIQTKAVPSYLIPDVRIDESTKHKKHFWNYDYICHGKNNNTYITNEYKDFYHIDLATQKAVDHLVNQARSSGQKIEAPDFFNYDLNSSKFKNLRVADISYLKKYFIDLDSIDSTIKNCDAKLNELESFSKTIFNTTTNEDTLKDMESNKFTDFIVFENITFKDVVHKHVLRHYHGPLGKVCNETMAVVTIIKSISNAAKLSKKISVKLHQIEKNDLLSRKELETYLKL